MNLEVVRISAVSLVALAVLAFPISKPPSTDLPDPKMLSYWASFFFLAMLSMVWLSDCPDVWTMRWLWLMLGGYFYRRSEFSAPKAWTWWLLPPLLWMLLHAHALGVLWILALLRLGLSASAWQAWVQICFFYFFNTSFSLPGWMSIPTLLLLFHVLPSSAGFTVVFIMLYCVGGQAAWWMQGLFAGCLYGVRPWVLSGLERSHALWGSWLWILFLWMALDASACLSA